MVVATLLLLLPHLCLNAVVMLKIWVYIYNQVANEELPDIMDKNAPFVQVTQVISYFIQVRLLIQQSTNI